MLTYDLSNKHVSMELQPQTADLGKACHIRIFPSSTAKLQIQNSSNNKRLVCHYPTTSQSHRRHQYFQKSIYFVLQSSFIHVIAALVLWIQTWLHGSFWSSIGIWHFDWGRATEITAVLIYSWITVHVTSSGWNGSDARFHVEFILNPRSAW